MRVLHYCAMGLRLKLIIFLFFIGLVQSRNSGLSESSYYTSEDTKPRLCEVGITACGANEECLVKGTHSGSKFGVCECVNDFRRSSSGECVRKADDTVSSPDGASATCEYGVEFCGENEECKVKNKRSKTGWCVCVEGYTRNKMKVCEHDRSNVTQVHSKTTKAPSDSHSQLVADAGPDLTINGPGALVVIDGRERSRGDIVQFSWRRAESSLASGRILNGSEQQHTLLFVPVVTGQYEFILTVTSQGGATAHDNVRITVQDVVGHRTIVMQLANAAYRFSEADLRGLETQIELLLGKPSTALNARPLVVVDSLTEHASDSSLTIEFSVVFELLDSSQPDAVTHAMWTDSADVRTGPNSVRYGDSHWVVDYLEQKLEEQRNRLLDFEVLHVGAKYCAYRVQDSSSNATTLDRCGAHAKCVDERRCACESLWLQSPTRRLRTHCDISLLAVIFLPIGIFLLLLGLAFACVRLCCARRRSLEERVRARLAKRERGRREVKRLLSDGSQKIRVEEKNVSLNNLFDSDDNYEVDMDTDDETGKTERDKVRGIKSNGAMNKLTVDADGDLNDAEVTAFVNDNVSVNVKSGMNLNSQKMDKTKA